MGSELRTLSLPLEEAALVVEDRGLGRRGPRFSLRHPLQIDDPVLHAAVGPELDFRLLARLPAHLDILGGNDHAGGHPPVVDDFAFDSAAAANLDLLVGLSGRRGARKNNSAQDRNRNAPAVHGTLTLLGQVAPSIDGRPRRHSCYLEYL
jgi:hypothetical protein